MDFNGEWWTIFRLSELYFLITKFLAHGPLQNASEVRLLCLMIYRIVSNLLNVIKLVIFCVFLQVLVKELERLKASVFLLCSNVYKYSFSIRIYDILVEQFSHVLHVFFVYMSNYKQVPWPYIPNGWNTLQPSHIVHKMHPSVTNLFFHFRYFLGESIGLARNMNKPLPNWWVIKTRFSCLRFSYCGAYKKYFRMKCSPRTCG